MKRRFQALHPDEFVPGAAALTPERLSARGIKGVIFDIDNTVVPQDDPADEHARQLFRMLHEAGIRTFIVSNNAEPRVKTFAGAVGSEYCFKARKPSAKGFREALRRMELSRGEVIAVGDQLFTDIWGANRAGIRSVLVPPVDPKKDTKGIRIKRFFERIVFRSWKKSEKNS